MDWFIDQVKRTSPRAAVSTWISLATRDYRSTLEKIPVPCLVAYGGRSALYNEEIAAYVRDRIPTASIAEFERAGHAVHIEQPTNFNKRLRSFVADIRS